MCPSETRTTTPTRHCAPYYKTHRSHILQKLNLHNSAEIALAAPGFYFSSKRAPPKAPGV
jgi:hypothetical protein